MSREGLEHIGREILRVEAERERPIYGKTRRAELGTRLQALRWALHVLLTDDPTEPPGEALEAFLGALRASDDSKETDA